MRRLLNRLFGRDAVENRTATVSHITESPDSRTEAERLIAEGNVLEDAGQLTEAEACYRAALKLCPDLARAYLNLGNAQAAQGQSETAAESYREALRLEPGYGAAHANLGKLYLNQRNYQNAAEHYADAVRALPDSADALVGLGCALEDLGRQTEALTIYRQALTLQPDFPGAKFNLGRILILLKQPDEAVKYIEEAMAVMPEHEAGHTLLGKAMSEWGYISEALSHLQQASQLLPKNPNLASIPLFTMNYLSDSTPEALFAAHLQYAPQCCAEFYPQCPSYPNTPDPERRLKIGYVSGDLRLHPVSRFIEPVFAHHDHALYEIHAFHSHHAHDEITERLKNRVDAWHPVWTTEDDPMADLIRSLGIDILVDLSGHTEHHRLTVFARKPAPVQATWLGYLGTTGLATMDYRICDIYTDPPGLTERFHTEKLARLPDSQWCYVPYVDLSPVGELPLLRQGYLTLGSFNNPSKLNDRVLELWAEILQAIPHARLRIAAVPAGRAQERVVSILQRSGITPERIEFAPRLPYRDYLQSIAAVDVALDPFPYNGGTTSIDTLIMGVPLVTLAGDRSIARGGVSLLSNLGLTELIAATPQNYVEIIQRLASDPARLAALRRSLRERVQTSPLMDGARFTRNLEALYRQMWRAWCGHQPPNQRIASSSAPISPFKPSLSFAQGDHETSD